MKHLLVKTENAHQETQDISDYFCWLAPGTPGPSERLLGRNEWRERRTLSETGLCLAVMCHFITFCDSAPCLLRALPPFVQLLSSIEGNEGYINTGDGLRRRLLDYFEARYVLTTLDLPVTVEESQGWENEGMRHGNLAVSFLNLSTFRSIILLKHLFMITEKPPVSFFCRGNSHTNQWTLYFS